MNSYANDLAQPILCPTDVQGNEATALAAIYEDDCNMAIWKRDLPQTVQQSVSEFLNNNVGLQASMTLSPEHANEVIYKALGSAAGVKDLSDNIAELVDVFCCLFELERVALRLTVLDKAMCPRFHVDHVPARLITTYHGSATEWLPHQFIDRTKLGHGSQGKPDDVSGLFKSTDNIQQLSSGDVALLKGERWDGNEGAGLVHRSPALLAGEKRLLLTMDFN